MLIHACHVRSSLCLPDYVTWTRVCVRYGTVSDTNLWRRQNAMLTISIDFHNIISSLELIVHRGSISS
ncbi:QWRF motif-containing protein 8 [Gossypium australe]|uniref:QWRF motif-containing protein 8 n=1 Tax=Gossypium australe TaxID=47621 RepID=A0A5B6VGW3_9ROSI|nr:QWRF motif-containing protein 8 [Gossypium australe]